MTAWVRQRGHTESKTSQDAGHIGDMQGNAKRGYSASQKRCRNRNNYLRPTVQSFLAPFLLFVYFVWCKGSTRWRHTQANSLTDRFVVLTFLLAKPQVRLAFLAI